MLCGIVMVKITHSTPKGSSAARLRVEGRIVGMAIEQLQAAVAEFGDASPILDLAGVCSSITTRRARSGR